MAEVRVMLVGIFETGAAWRAGLDSAGFKLTTCQTGLAAVTELTKAGVDVIVSQDALADLTAFQLCALLRINEATQQLPFVIIGGDSLGGDGLLKELARPTATIKLAELDKRLISLIEEQANLGKQLGFEPRPLLVSLSPLSASLDAKQGLGTLVDHLLTEMLIGGSVRSLTGFLAPHKRFLEAYFALADTLSGADLMGIAIGGLKNPWIAVKGKAGIAESTLNGLISEIKGKLHLTNEPVLEIDTSIPAGAEPEAGERHVFVIRSESGAAGSIAFINHLNKSFTASQLANMNALVRQMKPIVELLLAEEELQQFHNHEAYNASTDQLTGLYNLQFLLGFLQQQLLFSVRHKLPVGLMIMDIDNFARINAAFGMQAGDAVLMKLGAYLLNATRASDLCARYGGDEFAVVLPNTDLHGAQVLAEKIRLDIEQISFFEGLEKPGSHLTMSIGCAEFDMSDLNPETILRNAKHALQKAKGNGKNSVAG
jgi:diguanylate cyclase (GGDEF)-like protein